MRAANLVQPLLCDVDEHWRLFFDDAFDRAMIVDGLGFGYELLERVETDADLRRRVRVTPRLEPLAMKWLPGFSYVDDGTFDKATRVWRSRMIASHYTERVISATTVRADPDGDRRCRRTVALSVEIRAPGFGGLIESAAIKALRTGWESGAKYVNERLKAAQRNPKPLSHR